MSNKTRIVTAYYTLSNPPSYYFNDLKTLPFWKRVKACWYFLTTPAHKVRQHRLDNDISAHLSDQITKEIDQQILEEISEQFKQMEKLNKQFDLLNKTSDPFNKI